jgi:hypothetical protein
LIVNKDAFLPSFLLPVPLHHRQKNSIINPTEKRPGSHLVHTFIVMHTVKDISQSRMPFPSLQTVPGRTVIGQETQFMHLLMSNEASPPSHLQPCHLLFPGRWPAQSITTTPPHSTFVPPALLVADNFRAAPSSYLRFSPTATSKLRCSTCRLQRVQLLSYTARSRARAIAQKRKQKHPRRSR